MGLQNNAKRIVRAMTARLSIQSLEIQYAGIRPCLRTAQHRCYAEEVVTMVIIESTFHSRSLGLSQRNEPPKQ